MRPHIDAYPKDDPAYQQFLKDHPYLMQQNQARTTYVAAAEAPLDSNVVVGLKGAGGTFATLGQVGTLAMSSAGRAGDAILGVFGVESNSQDYWLGMTSDISTFKAEKLTTNRQDMTAKVITGVTGAAPIIALSFVSPPLAAVVGAVQAGDGTALSVMEQGGTPKAAAVAGGFQAVLSLATLGAAKYAPAPVFNSVFGTGAARTFIATAAAADVQAVGNMATAAYLESAGQSEIAQGFENTPDSLITQFGIGFGLHIGLTVAARGKPAPQTGPRRTSDTPEETTRPLTAQEEVPVSRPAPEAPRFSEPSTHEVDAPSMAQPKPRAQMTAREHAMDIAGRAAAAEPQVSAMINENLPQGGRLEGFDFRLKEVDSLTRKIESDSIADSIKVDEAARNINDALRYTYVVPKENFVPAIHETLAAFEAAGVKALDVKNTFTGDSKYKGVNTSLRMPDGQRIEVQFHTPESFHVKHEVNHGLYEEARLPTTSAARVIELNEQQRINNANIPTPEGIDTVKTYRTPKGIYPDDKGVHGYLPEPGARYGKPELDFTNPDFVAKNRDIRISYLNETKQLTDTIETMTASGKSPEEIAHRVIMERNAQQVAARSMMPPAEVAALEAFNMDNYGHPVGPTPKQLIVKYETWERVIEKALNKDLAINTLLGLHHPKGAPPAPQGPAPMGPAPQGPGPKGPAPQGPAPKVPGPQGPVSSKPASPMPAGAERIVPLSHKTTSGATITVTRGKTTTVIGAFQPDMQHIIKELAVPEIDGPRQQLIDGFSKPNEGGLEFS